MPSSIPLASSPSASRSSTNNSDTVCFKFLTLGDAGVGKTSFIVKYLHPELPIDSDYDATVGFDFYQTTLDPVTSATATRDDDDAENDDVVVAKSRTVNLQLWDTAGQERFRSLTSTFFRDATGFILMFDLTKPASFDALRSWADHLAAAAAATVEDPDDVVVVVCGNKKDLVEWQEEEEGYGGERRRRKRLREIFDENKLNPDVDYFETSAKTGANVAAAIERLARKAALVTAATAAKGNKRSRHPGRGSFLRHREEEVVVDVWRGGPGRKCVC